MHTAGVSKNIPAASCMTLPAFPPFRAGYADGVVQGQYSTQQGYPQQLSGVVRTAYLSWVQQMCYALLTSQASSSAVSSLLLSPLARMLTIR
jgi:hypothetical protein